MRPRMRSWRLSEGSPFMASAVLRGFVESGYLVADEEGWRAAIARRPTTSGPQVKQHRC